MLGRLASILGRLAKRGSSAANQSFLSGATHLAKDGVATKISSAYIGKYSIGGGALRMGAYGLGASALSYGASNIENMPGFNEWSPAARGLTQAGLTLGSYYAGYRGLKAGVRGVSGSIQGVMNSGQRLGLSSAGRGYARPGGSAIVSDPTTILYSRNIPQGWKGRRRRIHRQRNRKGPNRDAQFKVQNAPISRVQESWIGNGNSVIDKFENIASMPGRAAASMLGNVPGAVADLSKGIVTGPFSFANAGLAGLGLSRGSKGLLAGGGISGMFKESALAFGQMRHPYAGALAMGGAAGIGVSMIGYEAKRRKIGSYGASSPMMKTGTMRPFNNYAPNVVFMAHNRNRGM